MGERFARRHVAELVGVLIGAALVVSSATPARADAGGGENCGVFLESGLTICAPAGDDLHAAVTAQTGYTIVDGDETDAGRATTVSYLLARLYDNADYGGAYYEVWGSSGCSSAVGVRGGRRRSAEVGGGRRRSAASAGGVGVGVGGRRLRRREVCEKFGELGFGCLKPAVRSSTLPRCAPVIAYLVIKRRA